MCKFLFIAVGVLPSCAAVFAVSEAVSGAHIGAAPTNLKTAEFVFTVVYAHFFVCFVKKKTVSRLLFCISFNIPAPRRKPFR